jgi:undecaprenyl-diphosphatase
MSRVSDLQRRATSRRDPRPPLALTHPVTSSRVAVTLLGTAVALVVGLWLLEGWLLDGPTPLVDVVGFEWAADQRGPGAVAVARVLTHLGDLWVVAAVAGVLVILARLRSGRWDSTKLVVLTVGGVLVITAITKELTARPRPDEALTATLSLAFPSGHASRAAVVYLLLAWLAAKWAKHPVTRHLVALAAAAMVLATAWSRLVLGAHWATDVLAGMGLGAVWLVVVIALTRPVPLPSVRHGAGTEARAGSGTAGVRHT